MKKLLLTAFEPFGGLKSNASLDALSKIKNTIGDYQIDKKTIPVVFDDCFKEIEDIVLDYDAIIMLGEAGKRDVVTIERNAINIKNASIKDNNGNQPLNEKIVDDGLELIKTNIEIDSLYEKLKDNYQIEISLSAGEFVCNNLFYLVANKLKDTKIKYDFIHVPYIKNVNNNSKLELEEIVDIIEMVIKNI